MEANSIIKKNYKIESKEEKTEILFHSNPSKIQFYKDLTNNSYCKYWYDNSFSLFKSFNNIFYIVYANKFYSIIFLNLTTNKIIIEIKNAHKNYITHFSHCFDEINKRDLLISLSDDDNDLKLWNINNFECILNIKNGISFSSACFLKDHNQYYIVTCNDNNKYGNINPIKIFDLKGNKIKEINYLNDSTYFIDTYYDKNLSKNFIITGNGGYSQSYDYNENKIYFKYIEKNNEDTSTIYHMCIIIDDSDKVIKMIESSSAGIIRIWDFHSRKLLNKINIYIDWLNSLCLWKEDYLFVGCSDKSIKLINLNTKKVIKELKGHRDRILSIKKIIHPKYGECLITQDADKSQIKLWIISK